MFYAVCVGGAEERCIAAAFYSSRDAYTYSTYFKHVVVVT